MGDDLGMPPSPITGLAAGTAQMHEMFMSYVEAGFTRAEALQLIIAIMQAGIQQNNQGGQS